MGFKIHHKNNRFLTGAKPQKLRLLHVLINERIDGAHSATLTIDRNLGLVSVRPYRRKRTYEMPLQWVGEAIVQKVALTEKQSEKQAKKLARRRR